MRKSSRRSGPALPRQSDHIQHSESWSGLLKGDPVRISGVKSRSASWSFLSHVVNTRTNEEWVEVVGGRPGERKVRSFRLDQVFPPGRARKELPSLQDAPQLPLL
ncbi:MAG: hypothetical protein ACYDEP_06005 [Acidimicrobiales bacterium]